MCTHNRKHINTHRHTYRQTHTVCAVSQIGILVHYGDVIMGAIASQITSLPIVYSIIYSDADQRKHQNSASLIFVWGIHRGSVNSPHEWPVTQKMFPFDDVIMGIYWLIYCLGQIWWWYKTPWYKYQWENVWRKDVPHSMVASNDMSGSLGHPHTLHINYRYL